MSRDILGAIVDRLVENVVAGEVLKLNRWLAALTYFIRQRGYAYIDTISPVLGARTRAIRNIIGRESKI